MGLPAVIRPLIARIRKPKSRSVWTRGEDAAAKLMKQHGYRLLARNLRLGMGEIDLLCLDTKADCVVVVEVKARVRNSSATPNPEANITAAKQRKLRSLAKAISARDDCKGKGIRIDVVAVEFAPNESKPIAIRHYQNAVGA